MLRHPVEAFIRTTTDDSAAARRRLVLRSRKAFTEKLIGKTVPGRFQFVGIDRQIVPLPAGRRT